MTTRIVTKAETEPPEEDVDVFFCTECGERYKDQHAKGCPRLDDDPLTPELEKQSEVAGEVSQGIGEFLVWLTGAKGYVIAEYRVPENSLFNEEKLMPVGRRPKEWLAEYYGLDLDKMEIERQAILEYIRMEDGIQLGERR